MKKWSEVKQAILDKLQMTDKEAEQQSYLAKFPRFANECLNTLANDIKPNIKKLVDASGNSLVTTENNEVITMPDDFLSFANATNYLNGEPDPIIVYLGGNEVVLPEIGTYVIFYNSTYPEILDNTGKNGDDDLGIPASLLNVVPTYVASQCLAQDDIQRSTILRNEYELMTSSLDNNVLEESAHFKSVGGWY